MHVFFSDTGMVPWCILQSLILQVICLAFHSMPLELVLNHYVLLSLYTLCLLPLITKPSGWDTTSFKSPCRNAGLTSKWFTSHPFELVRQWWTLWFQCVLLERRVLHSLCHIFVYILLTRVLIYTYLCFHQNYIWSWRSTWGQSVLLL